MMIPQADASSALSHHWKFLFFWRRHRDPPTLPIEIWDQILEHVIHVPYLFSSSFKSNEFHLFINSRLIRYEPFTYAQSELERKRLRLVCHLFDALLSRKSTRWAEIYHPNSQSISKGTKRVGFLGRLDGKADEIQWENGYSTSVMLFGSYNTDTSDTEKDLSILFEQAPNFPNVQSFVFHHNRSSFPQSFLPQLQNSFSKLTTLILICPKLKLS
jgi:hypothetical protein